MSYCKHEECRATARAELGHIDVVLGARQQGKGELARQVKAINEGEVRCRIVARRGAVSAPFPGEGE